jgi:hypothetical protein
MITMLKVNSSAGEQTVTVRGLRALLADTGTYSDVLTAMLDTEQADITLHDGVAAKVTFAETGAEIWAKATGKSGQGNLALRSPFRPPHHEYEATVSLRLELTANIELSASSRAEAQYLIDRVLRHMCKPPPGFNVILSDEELNDFTSNLDYAASGRPHMLGVFDHTVTDLRERLLITRQEVCS